MMMVKDASMVSTVKPDIRCAMVVCSGNSVIHGSIGAQWSTPPHKCMAIYDTHDMIRMDAVQSHTERDTTQVSEMKSEQTSTPCHVFKTAAMQHTPDPNVYVLVHKAGSVDSAVSNEIQTNRKETGSSSGSSNHVSILIRWMHIRRVFPRFPHFFEYACLFIFALALILVLLENWI
jgi:hypothetical protein